MIVSASVPFSPNKSWTSTGRLGVLRSGCEVSVVFLDRSPTCHSQSSGDLGIVDRVDFLSRCDQSIVG